MPIVSIATSALLPAKHAHLTPTAILAFQVISKLTMINASMDPLITPIKETGQVLLSDMISQIEISRINMHMGSI